MHFFTFRKTNTKIDLVIFVFLSFFLVSSNAFAQSTNTASHPAQKVRSQIQQTVLRLTTQSNQEKVKWRANQLNPTLILNLHLPLQGETPLQQASLFIQQYKQMWPNIDVKVQEVNHRKNRTVVSVVGSINQAPILNQNTKLLIQDQKLINLSNGLDGIYKLNQATLKETELPRLLVLKKVIPQGTQVQIKRGWIVYAGEATEVFECEVALVPLHSQPIYRVHGQTGEIITTSSRVRR
jgi:hypothetical protein